MLFFPPRHKFRKLFNRNNLKVSYSCMRNMKTIVNGHNKKILSEDTRSEERTCNCPRNRVCPLAGNCLSKNTLYGATISSNLPIWDPHIHFQPQRTRKDRNCQGSLGNQRSRRRLKHPVEDHRARSVVQPSVQKTQPFHC